MNAAVARSLRLLLGTITVGAVLAACGGDGDAAQEPDATGATGTETTSAPPPSPSPTLELEVGGGEPVELKIVARAGFLRQRLEVPSGAEVSLTLVNEDPVPHNVSVYVDDQTDQSIFVGDRIGTGRITYEFGAPVEPGTYYFVCDIHPSIMNGDFVVT